MAPVLSLSSTFLCFDHEHNRQDQSKENSSECEGQPKPGLPQRYADPKHPCHTRSCNKAPSAFHQLYESIKTSDITCLAFMAGLDKSCYKAADYQWESCPKGIENEAWE